MQLNRRTTSAVIILSGVMALFLGTKSVEQYYREWSLRRSHAVANAVAVQVTSRRVRGGCSTDVLLEFKPLGSSETYQITVDFLGTDDPNCLDVSQSVGDTMEIAYVPENPEIHRPYWGKLDRGLEPHEWIVSGIGAALSALALAYFVLLRRALPKIHQEQVE